MIYKIYLLLIIALTSISCEYLKNVDKTFEPLVLKYGEECSTTNDSCIIDFKKIIPFEWDKLYIIRPESEADEISKLLGVNYNTVKIVPENMHRMIFTLKDEIVFEENFGSGAHLGYPYFNSVPLPYDSSSYSNDKKCYTRVNPYINSNESIFLVKKVKKEKGCYYNLVLKKNFNNKIEYVPGVY
ncbi:hypothetical protein BH10BAC2_BH10BAC2_25730 [soil metagenome]